MVVIGLSGFRVVGSVGLRIQGPFEGFLSGFPKAGVRIGLVQGFYGLVLRV